MKSSVECKDKDKLTVSLAVYNEPFIMSAYVRYNHHLTCSTHLASLLELYTCTCMV